MVVHTFNPRAWKAEAGLSQRVPEQPDLYRETGYGGGGQERKQMPWCASLISVLLQLEGGRKTVSKELG